MDVSSLVFVLCSVGSGVCDELIVRPEECYSVCVCTDARVCVCDVEISILRRPRARFWLLHHREKSFKYLKFVEVLKTCGETL